MMSLFARYLPLDDNRESVGQDSACSGTVIGSLLGNSNGRAEGGEDMDDIQAQEKVGVA